MLGAVQLLSRPHAEHKSKENNIFSNSSSMQAMFIHFLLSHRWTALTRVSEMRNLIERVTFLRINLTTIKYSTLDVTCRGTTFPILCRFKERILCSKVNDKSPFNNRFLNF